ncbi:MAG: hypothetical protein FWD13_00875 [Treponema sp.]|nr:hypothetical protein [Treponema sp.]
MNNSNKYKNRWLYSALTGGGVITLISFLLVLCFVSCDVDPDYLKKIDDEVAWHNAEKLNVRLEYPIRWGTSNPVQGSIAPGLIDIRKGYEFSIEFFAEQDLSLVSMRVYKTAAFEALGDWRNSTDVAGVLNSQAALNGRLDGSDAVILVSPDAIPPSGGRFTFKIESTENITIVPYCEPRPRILRSNPPLVPSLNPFPFNQKVSLIFNMPLDKESIQDNIRVEAIHRISSQPIGPDGNITSYFNMTYNENENTVELTAKDDEIILENLKMLSINVIVEPGIKNITGNTMAGAQLISYITDASEARIVYRADNINAVRGIKDGDNYVYTEAPFSDTNTQWNNPLIDRRFNEIKGNKTRINFTVTNPQDITLYPNRFTIREMMVFDLNGFPDTHIVEPAKTYTLKAAGQEFDSSVMALQEEDYSYTLYYELKSSTSGIIHLIVLPWYQGETNNETIIAQDLSAASLAGSYVTVVMDKTAPFVNLDNLNASITGGYLVSGTHLFHGTADMLVTLNGVNMISDIGISYVNAWNRPWTMDERNTLQWRILIENRTTDDWTVHYPGEWQPTSVNSINISAAVMNLTNNINYTVTVQFIDRMGNTSDTTSMVLGIIRRISNVAPIPVTGLRAVCTETQANRTDITVSWTLPIGMDRAVVTMTGFDDETIYREERTGAITQSHTFRVDSLNTSGIRDGHAVSNVRRYDITVTAYNDAGASTVETRRIWNIPGMDVSAIAITEINTAAEFYAISEYPLRQYMLTDDIILTNHTPISNFSGGLFGNGYTITIKSFNNADPATNTGLFGIANNAIVRDLTLIFDADPESNEPDDKIVIIPHNTVIENYGGIAGQATGTTQIRNIITTGSLEATFAFVNEKRIGGIVGNIQANVIINNINAGINFKNKAIGTNSVLFGGIMGGLSGSGNSASMRGRVVISAVYVTGSLEHTQTNQDNNNSTTSGYMAVGGLIGDYGTYVTIRDIEFSGYLKVVKIGTGNPNNSSGIGGIACSTSNVLFINCRVSGSVEIPNSFESNESINLGGLFGSIHSSTEIRESWVSGDIISLKSGNGELRFGGLIGEARDNSKVEDSFYEQGSIISIGTGGLLTLGGVIGQVVVSRNVTMKNTYSRAHIVSGSISNGQVYVGGFAGHIREANLIECYAKTNVHAYGNSNVFAGGLVGFWVVPGGDFSISKSFATGNVIAAGDSSGEIIAGGLIGLIQAYINIARDYEGIISINNSYALGNVIVDRLRSNIYSSAGGLIGSIRDDVDSLSPGRHYKINYCFSGGEVTVKSNGSGPVYAGGIIGYMDITGENNTGTIKNTASLSRSITAMGSGTLNIGRIYGEVTNGVPAANRARNYAVDTMFLGTANIYTNNPYPVFTPVSITNNSVEKDGQSLSMQQFSISTSSWTNTTLLDFGSQTGIWNFSTVSRGYPTLNGLGGQ